MVNLSTVLAFQKSGLQRRQKRMREIGTDGDNEFATPSPKRLQTSSFSSILPSSSPPYSPSSPDRDVSFTSPRERETFAEAAERNHVYNLGLLYFFS